MSESCNQRLARDTVGNFQQGTDHGRGLTASQTSLSALSFPLLLHFLNSMTLSNQQHRQLCEFASLVLVNRPRQGLLLFLDLSFSSPLFFPFFLSRSMIGVFSVQMFQRSLQTLKERLSL